MNTVSNLLRAATEALATVSESARLDASVLLSLASNLSRTRLLADPAGEIEAADCTKFFELVTLRRKGTPVAYITGEREFYSRSFKVSSAVLIPRPETEQLVEIALAHLKNVAMIGTPNILDLGTGSGCIAITLALESAATRRAVRITAVDSSADAIEIARENSKILGAEGVIFTNSNWFESVNGVYDLIVTNPPYIPRGDPHTSPDTKFEPPAALFSGGDGCDAYREIFRSAGRFLKRGGVLIGEHGISQGATIREIAMQHGFSLDAVRTHQDLTGRDRFVVCRT